MQELVSLSERFGLHVTFNRPDKQTYLDIVHRLANDAGIDMKEKEIEINGKKKKIAIKYSKIVLKKSKFPSIVSPKSNLSVVM